MVTLSWAVTSYWIVFHLSAFYTKEFAAKTVAPLQPLLKGCEKHHNSLILH